MYDPLRVLIVEESEGAALSIERQLEQGGLIVECERVGSLPLMEKALHGRPWDVIISDVSNLRSSGKDSLRLYREQGVDIPFIAVADPQGEELAVELLKGGAHDYVPKSSLGRLPEAVRHEVQAAQERRIVRQMEANAAFLASIVECSDDAIIGTTFDGTVVSWNTGAERLYGHGSSEMIGRSIEVLFHPYRPKDFPDFLEAIQQGERRDRIDTVRLQKDGSQVEVSVAISPIKDSKGRIVGAADVSRDITRRKEEENERLKLIEDLTAALAQANRTAEQARV